MCVQIMARFAFTMALFGVHSNEKKRKENPLWWYHMSLS